MKYKTITIKGRTYYLHRWRMEKFLGRKLGKYEHIHHINGDKSDNHLCNLKIVSISEHNRIHQTGRRLSESTKKKIGKANSVSLKGKKMPMSVRKKISVAHIGMNTWSKGRKLSKKTRLKMSNSRKGWKYSKKTIHRMRVAAIKREALKRIKN